MVKFLVTGGAGFIGSNIVEELLKLGYKVRVIDNMSTGKWSNVKEFKKNKRYEFIQGDVTVESDCDRACENVDYVLHQAALGSVPRSVVDPFGVNDNNVRAAIRIVIVAAKAKVKRLVYASSASVYGDVSVPSVDELTRLDPANPYAVSKLAGEQYARIIGKLRGLDVVALRYFNVFGPRQDPQGQYAAVIPKFIRMMLHGEQPIIDGNGEQFRDFTHVENVARANIAACSLDFKSANFSGRVYNIGMGGRTTINELHDAVARCLGVVANKKYGPSRSGDVGGSMADISRAKRELGYIPIVSTQSGIERTVKWYKEKD